MKRRSLGRVQRAPAPYTKYKKRPYRYSAAFQTWRHETVGKVQHAEKARAERKGAKKAT